MYLSNHLLAPKEGLQGLSLDQTGLPPLVFGLVERGVARPLIYTSIYTFRDFIIFVKKHEIHVFLGQKGSYFLYKIGIEGSSLTPQYLDD